MKKGHKREQPENIFTGIDKCHICELPLSGSFLYDIVITSHGKYVHTKVCHDKLIKEETEKENNRINEIITKNEVKVNNKALRSIL